MTKGSTKKDAKKAKGSAPDALHTPVGRICHVLRVITAPAPAALVLLSIVFGVQPQLTGGLAGYLTALLFLAVLPVLGYPLQRFIPGFKNKGREGQRHLVILFSVAGYIGGCVYAVAAKAPDSLALIYLTYLFSGIGVLVFNKAFKIRASGHACGVAGPLALLVHFFGPVGLWGLVVLALVYFSSLKIHRHKLSELLWGTAIPFAAMLGAGAVL